MIYTVTFNPSLDYIVRLDKFTAGEINRVNYEQVLAGGKGINVSIVLGNLGHESTALGFVAGFTGEEIKRQLKDRGVKTDFVQLESGFSRINVKAKAQQETEINGQGPDISEARQAELFSQLDKLGKGDTLVLAGSIPKTLPDNIYERIMAHLQSRDIRIVVDAEKRLLLNAEQPRARRHVRRHAEDGRGNHHLRQKAAGAGRDQRAHLHGGRRRDPAHGRGRHL